MEPLKGIAERYWIAYYLVYVAGVGFGLWRYRPWQETGKDELLVLVGIFALATAAALLAAILLEVIGRMVLLIPAEIKRLKDLGREQGREEGREQGREEGRREERQRIEEELRLAAERRPEPVAIPEASLQEAREAGWREGREAERQRIIAAFIAQGERDADGALRVTLPPEVVKILFDESD